MSDKDIKKYIKQVRSEADKDIKRYIGSLKEEFQGRVKGIAEQYSDIKKTLESHGNQIANVTMDIMEVKRDVKEIKFNLVTGLDNKVDKKHFVDLELRVRKVEKS